MKLTPSHRLYGLGAILLATLGFCSNEFSKIGSRSFLISLAIAGVAYLLAVRELSRTSRIPPRVIVIGLLMSASWHVLFLRMPPGPDDDIHRYVWDGRVQRLGYNPYIVVPNDPAVRSLHTSETRTLNHPDLPSLYPPGAELFFRAVTSIRESVFAMKVAFVLCDWGIVLVLLDVLRRSGRGTQWVLAYAWHPLLAIEVAGSGHVDIVGALLLVISFAALCRHWRVAAALTFGLAVSVKLLPIVLLPLYWRRVRVRDSLLAMVVFGVLYVPFLASGRAGTPVLHRIPTGSLGTYLHSFRFNDPVFAVLERVAAPEVVVALAVIAGFLVAIWMASKSRRLTGSAFAWPMAASLLFAPVVYPWYLLWVLPFLRRVSTLPILVWTVSILPTYYVWHLRTEGGLWIVPDWVLLVEYGLVAITAAVIAWRSMTQPGRALSKAERS